MPQNQTEAASCTERERKAALLAGTASPPGVNAAAPREPHVSPQPPPPRRRPKKKKTAAPARNVADRPPIRGPPLLAYSIENPKAAELWTQTEAADYLRVSPRTLERMRVKGSGPKYVKTNRRVLYRAADIAAWLEDRTRSSTSERGAERAPPSLQDRAPARAITGAGHDRGKLSRPPGRDPADALGDGSGGGGPPG